MVNAEESNYIEATHLALHNHLSQTVEGRMVRRYVLLGFRARACRSSLLTYSAEIG